MAADNTIEYASGIPVVARQLLTDRWPQIDKQLGDRGHQGKSFQWRVDVAVETDDCFSLCACSGDDKRLASTTSAALNSGEADPLLWQSEDDGTEPVGKEGMRTRFEEAKKDYKDFGGWKSFKSGEWLLTLIRKCFKNYFERANAEYFRKKYKSRDVDFIAKKLIKVAAKNAAILGGLTGLLVSTDEVVALATGGELVVGLPANIAIAVTAIGAEMVLLLRMQLQLVANLAKLYEVPLDTEDPEDILIILAYAFGGAVAEEAGKFVAKAAGHVAGDVAKKIFQKELLQALKSLGKKLGVKILQRSIVKYTVPGISMAVGSTWNYFAVNSVGKIACKHFQKRKAESQGQ
jgi:uncharacterized protein (DUF697 family)